MIRLGRLKKRAEFLAVAGTRRKWAQPGVIVQLRR
ncbi:ribonuclease P, partial [Inquilinus limosus MP06]